MMSLSISKEMLTPVIEQQVKAMMATILGCQSCYFNNFCDDNRDVLVTGACSGYMRSDCKSVIFKEVK